MMQPVIRKNHMDIAWHEYTDENGADIPVTQASLTEKASIIGRSGDYVSVLWNRCMASQKFDEYPG